jgi:hypothetical protein
MNSMMISLPCSLAVALFVGRIGLATLGLPENPQWLLAAVVLCTILLFRRSVVELGFIAALTAFAQLNSAALGNQYIGEDMMLTLLLVIILLPSTVDLMGIRMNARTSSK